MRFRNLSRPATIASLLAIGALAIAGCGGSSSDESSDQGPIEGSWKGTFTQSGVADFEGYVEIDTLRAGMASGTVFYPTINGSGACSGVLVYKGNEGDDYLFTEKIVTSENPNCAKRGNVKIASVDDGSGITYSWNSGNRYSVGNLQEWDD